MLARLANNLFWMGRYIERSEHLARYLNVNYFSSLDAPNELSQSRQFVLRSIMFMSSNEIIKIGGIDKLKEFKQSIVKVIKSNELSAFKLDGKTLSLVPYKSKGAYINILDKYMKFEMGYWSLKKLEKLHPYC